MRLPHLSTVLLLVLTTTPAHSAGVNFVWNSCAAEGGAQNKDFACNTNSGSHVLVGSFILGSGVGDFVGLEAKVDISADADSLPAWWQIYGAGNCRAALSTSFSFASDPNEDCLDPWAGQGTGGIGAYRMAWTVPQVPGGGPATAQVVLVCAVPSTMPQELAASTEYYGFKLIITSAKTLGSGACAGCSTPVCLTLSEIKIVESDNRAHVLSDPIVSSTATWQSPQECPGSFASQSVTWGQIRALMH